MTLKLKVKDIDNLYVDGLSSLQANTCWNDVSKLSGYGAVKKEWNFESSTFKLKSKAHYLTPLGNLSMHAKIMFLSYTIKE